MPLHSIRVKFASWLIVAAAALQWSTHGLAMEPQHASSPSGQEKQMLASLSPPSAKLRWSREPFDELAVPIVSGTVSRKWHIVQTAIDGEAAILDSCLAQQECPRAARELLDIIAQGRERDGLARIGVINRAVNLAIVPTSDMKQWGVADHWSPPLETLTTGHGDCEDYAIVKYVALINAGVPRADVKLVIVHNRFPDEGHAVVAARVDDRWFILDNRSHALVPDINLRRATPLFVLDYAGAKMFVPEMAGERGPVNEFVRIDTEISSTARH
jgi:predicted transglutaminase-like cysteine proteinase